MLQAYYKLSANDWSVDSTDDPLGELLSLTTLNSMNSLDNACCISLYINSLQQPNLTEQAISEAASVLGPTGQETAFGIQVRGNDITPGDTVTVELTAGEVNSQVMAADVQSVVSSLFKTRIIGTTVLEMLAQTRLNQIYENQSMNQIVNDLANQAGVSTGQIDTGSTYSCFVVHESRTLLEHIRQLALRDGMDVYADTDNKLTVSVFNKSSADHIFRYGMEIIDMQISMNDPVVNLVRISGESPASNQGTDTWHWLVKDISSFQSEAGDEGRLLAIQDGAVRTKDAADSLAAAKLGAIKDQSILGRLKILGNPAVKLADAIEIQDAPKPELNGLFKVTEVHHILNKQSGFVTFVGFSGCGGAVGLGGVTGGFGV